MAKEEMFAELTELHNTFSALERGEDPTGITEPSDRLVISLKKAFGKARTKKKN